MPDLKFKTKEEFPEELREHAVEKDGAFVCNVVPAKKLVEFRDNNITAMRERDEWKNKTTSYVAAFGEDIEGLKTELVTLREVKQKVDDGKLSGTDKIESTVASRVKVFEDGYKTQLAEVNQKLQNVTAAAGDYKAKFHGSVLRQEITAVVLQTESGANPAALTDILAIAMPDFAVQDDGKMVRVHPATGQPVYGADGVTPESPKEWLAGLLKSKPWFVKPSAGGGATGNREGSNNFGMSDAELQKKSPTERLKIARAAQAR